MTAGRPKIVVSLPGRTVAELRQQLLVAKEAGGDAAEVRVDRLAGGEAEQLERLFPSPVPLVGTFRSRTEGGEGADGGDERTAALLRIASLPFRWIDLEARRDLPLLDRLPPPERLGRIVSAHCPEGPADEWKARLRELEEVDAVGKLVVRASVGETVGELALEAQRVGEGIVVLTTGAGGALLRLWSRRFRFPLVYAALPASSTSPPVEPSQLPCDRLRAFLDADEPGPLFAICGRPVAHSRSPEIHARWMEAQHRSGMYVALEFQEEREFLDALGPLADGGFGGVNVTHPFKPAAAAAATELGPGAIACGVANCLTFRDGGVYAENTDLAAMLQRLGELKSSGRWDGRALTVVGAGGAARATLAAARELGARASVVARRPAEAEALARTFGATAPAEGQAAAGNLLVHATNVGRDPARRLEIPLAPLLAPGGHVVDWVYGGTSPELRAAAEQAGATYEDGWRLLVYQAAASYALWWDAVPPASAVQAMVQEGLRAA